MRRSWVVGLALLASAVASADDKKLGLGVYLPATIENREKQAEFAQALAAQLTTLLGQPVSAYPFARHEDFAKAVGDGTLDFAVSEAVVLAQAKGEFTAVATCALEGEAGARWAVVAEQHSTVGRMAGKRLAMVKGPGATDAQFVSNVIFGGDLPPTHFQLVFVPSAESAIRAIEAKKADAALVLAAQAPSNLKVLYRSGRVNGAVLVNLKGNIADLKAAAEKLRPVAPFTKFAPAAADEVGQLRRRIAKPPNTRIPLVSESPIWRPDATALPPFKAVALRYPPFVEFVEVSKDQPND